MARGIFQIGLREFDGTVVGADRFLTLAGSPATGVGEVPPEEILIGLKAGRFLEGGGRLRVHFAKEVDGAEV